MLLLHLFHTWFEWNLYASNLLAIGLVTFWNFGMNARFNWGLGQASETNSAALPADGPVNLGVESARGLQPRQRSCKMMERLYLLGAAMILLFSAAAKIISAGERTRILENADSIVFFLSNRQMMLLAAALELCVAFGVLWPRTESLNVRTRFGLVAWLASLFAVYRAGLLLANDPRPCKCLGNCLARIGLSEWQIQSLAVAMLAYLLVPSFAWLVNRWRTATQISSESPIEK